MDKPKKFDEPFVRMHKEKIAFDALENANALMNEAQLLISRKFYARAAFLCITSLEELAKVVVLSEKKINTKLLKSLIRHELKAPIIMDLVQELLLYETSIFVGEEQKQRMIDRLPKMREDTLYTRLKETKKNSFRPNNLYWKKRALNLYGYLANLSCTGESEASDFCFCAS
ncbi:MAG: AbiV family abortive infection protein, partial [Candidatus Komeilibacteria bacterium]|nr:AbiV family abortive infection protein [Candidatus Komeilibacteria bacterium]